MSWNSVVSAVNSRELRRIVDKCNNKAKKLRETEQKKHVIWKTTNTEICVSGAMGTYCFAKKKIFSHSFSFHLSLRFLFFLSSDDDDDESILKHIFHEQSNIFHQKVKRLNCCDWRVDSSNEIYSAENVQFLWKHLTSLKIQTKKAESQRERREEKSVLSSYFAAAFSSTDLCVWWHLVHVDMSPVWFRFVRAHTRWLGDCVFYCAWERRFRDSLHAQFRPLSASVYRCECSHWAHFELTLNGIPLQLPLTNCFTCKITVHEQNPTTVCAHFFYSSNFDETSTYSHHILCDFYIFQSTKKY